MLVPPSTLLRRSFLLVSELWLRCREGGPGSLTSEGFRFYARPGSGASRSFLRPSPRRWLQLGRDSAYSFGHGCSSCCGSGFGCGSCSFGYGYGCGFCCGCVHPIRSASRRMR